MNNSKTNLFVSCYELGHQPAGITMPIALLRQAGYEAEAMDVSVQGFDSDMVRRAQFVGISVPMHTALRLGLRVAEEIRKLNPDCHICFYGLYASLNSRYLLDTVADSIVGGEFEEALVDLIKTVNSGGPIETDRVSTKLHASKPVLGRLNFVVPDRTAVPPLQHYAKLEHEGEERLAGYVEASRGCLHHCTHCPIPPVYGGRFFVVPHQIVLEDIRRLAGSGARHITFGDPDFLNGPGHALQIIRSLHTEFPNLTFDFTAKVEHILKHRELFPEFAASGCIFVVSAVESMSDAVLLRLDKGHTRADVTEALEILRGAGIAMRPTFVPFTPWATREDYLDILEFIETQSLIDHVDPVQYSIRLLVPPGSLLSSQPDSQQWLGRLIQEAFTYEWFHPDPQMDELHRRVSALIEIAASRNEDAFKTFYDVCELAQAAGSDESAVKFHAPIDPSRLRPPRLTEAWFC